MNQATTDPGPTTDLFTQLAAIRRERQPEGLAAVLRGYAELFERVVDDDTRRVLADETERLVREDAAGRAPGVGDVAPTLRLPGVDGETFALTDALRTGPVVVVFYRGGWCPYCNVHLGSLQARLAEIQSLGGSLVAVSPERPERGAETKLAEGLAFPVLTDAGQRAAEAWGLLFEMSPALAERTRAMGLDLPTINGEAGFRLPIPGTFVVGPDGRVVRAWVDPDYRRRVEPEEVLAVLRDDAGVVGVDDDGSIAKEVAL